MKQLPSLSTACHTVSTNQPWLELTWTEPEPLSYVRIYNRQSSQMRLGEYTISYRAAGDSSWTECARGRVPCADAT